MPKKKAVSPGRPRDPSTDRAILRAALALFIERGIDVVSIEAIAKRAGVSRTTIYRRWSSKEELLARAIETARDRVAPSTEVLGQIIPKLEPHEFAQQLLDMAVDLWSNKELRHLAVRLMGAQLTCPELAETYWNTYAESRWTLFLAMLERMRGEGLIPASTDVEILAHMIGGGMMFRLFFAPSRVEWSRAQIRSFLVRLFRQAGFDLPGGTRRK